MDISCRDSIELLENVRKVFFRYSASVVLDLYGHFIVFIEDSDAYDRVCGIFDGIVYDCGKEVLNVEFIRLALYMLSTVYVKHRFLPCVHPGSLNESADDFLKIDDSRIIFVFPALYRYRKDMFDLGRELGELRFHYFKVTAPSVRIRIGREIPQGICRCHGDGYRGLQFVGYVVREVTSHLLKGLLTEHCPDKIYKYASEKDDDGD